MTSSKRRPTELVDMGKLLAMQGIEPLTLTQIAGPGHPTKAQVPPLGEIIIGRDEECHVVLDEDAASRLHAKILYTDYQPELLDLGSTNGTFLNGKPIHRAFLKHGDEIQVGSCVFEVSVGTEELRAHGAQEAQGSFERFESLIRKSRDRAPSRQQSSAISGQLSEIRLTSLLQIIESDKSTGTLAVISGGREGKLYIHQGAVRHATYGRARGAKALYRLMVLEDGHFDLFIPGRSPEYDTVEGNLSRHLLEAMRQKDELTHCLKSLPPSTASLALNPEKHIVPARVPPSVFDVLAAVGRFKTVGKVFERCQLPDFEIGRILHVLLKHNVLKLESEGQGTERALEVKVTNSGSS
jgi:pSer/pThr/pTyr-binding forkhead associated (FHA) protein